MLYEPEHKWAPCTDHVDIRDVEHQNPSCDVRLDSGSLRRVTLMFSLLEYVAKREYVDEERQHWPQSISKKVKSPCLAVVLHCSDYHTNPSRGTHSPA